MSASDQDDHRNSALREQTIALAGLVQAVVLVDQLAKRGQVASGPFQAVIGSLFAFDAKDSTSVYGGLAPLADGFGALEQLITQHPGERYRTLLRYVIGVLHIQNKLRKRKDLLAILASRIRQAERQAAHFSPAHDNVLANLADIYQDTLGQFRHRIMVVGDVHFLQQAHVADKVRALLLAGVRAATLWRQSGGSRLKLLWHRSRYVEQAHLLHHAAREALAEQEQQGPSEF